MHLLRTVAAAAFVAVLCAPQVGRGAPQTPDCQPQAQPDPDPELIQFNAQWMEFGSTGPVEAVAGEKLRVQVLDSDPRRRWVLQTDYTDPVGTDAKAGLDVIASLLAPGTDRVEVRAASPQAEELSKRAVALSNAVKAFLTAGTANVAALEKLELDQRTLTDLRVQVEAKKSDLDPSELAIGKAKTAEALASSISERCRTALAHRVVEFTVRPGFRRISVRACSRQLEVGEDGKVTEKPPVCSRSTYEIPVRESASGPRVTAGVLVPVYGKKPRDFYLDTSNGGTLASARRSSPTGDPEAAVFVSARWPLGRGRWGVGPEVGFGVGNRMGELFSLGGTIDFWGVGLGLGAALDTKGTREAIPGAGTGTALERTQSSSLVSWYVRFGFSSELWEAVSRATGTSRPNNVAQKTPEPTNSTGLAAPVK